MSDPKYLNLVEKTLQTFDSVNEWADVIKFLNSLSRALTTYSQYDVIPLKVIVAKRLAQCLNPSLPAGVHSKALEVYALIFKNIGSAHLSQDLNLYSFGLFPLFQYATMSVKPQLINLFSDFYLPLKENLIPCLRGFILAILPGLEEEGNEFFDSVLSLFDGLMKNIDIGLFYDAFWNAMTLSPQHRLASIHFLSKRFPSISEVKDLSQVGHHQHLLVYAFSCTLSDASVLAQRGILDILMNHFPLNKPLLKSEYYQQLMKSALCVVLRKDMSLNRRLYVWLFGNGEKTEDQILYLKQHSLLFILNALKEMLFSNIGNISELTRPYKVLISLMDKEEIGNILVESIFSDVLYSLEFQSRRKLENQQELFQTATMFFDMIDPWIIWSRIIKIFEESFLKEEQQKDLDLILFFLENFKMREENTLELHIYYFLTISVNHLQNDSLVKKPLLLNNILKISNLLLHLVAMKLRSSQRPALLAENEASASDLDFNIEIVLSLYQNTQLNDFYRHSYFKYYPIIIQKNFLNFMFQSLQKAISSILSSPDFHREHILLENLKIIFLLFTEFAKDSSEQEQIAFSLKTDQQEEFLEHHPWLKILIEKICNSQESEVLMLLLNFLFTLIELNYLPTQLLYSQNLIKQFCTQIWRNINSNQNQNFSVIKLLWKLHHLSPMNSVEKVICEFLLDEEKEKNLYHYEKFGYFWRVSDNVPNASISFSRPLFLMIDLLKSPSLEKKRAGETFLKCSLKSLNRLIDPMLVILLDPSLVRIRKTEQLALNDEKEIEAEVLYYQTQINAQQIIYLFGLLLEIFQYGGQILVKNLSMLSVQNEHLLQLYHYSDQNHQEFTSISLPVELNYLDLLLYTSINFLLTEEEEYEKNDITLIQNQAAEFLNSFISRAYQQQNSLFFELAIILMKKLLLCIHHHHLDLQTKLLSLLHSIFSFTLNSSFSSSADESDFREQLEMLGQILWLGIKKENQLLPYYLDFILSSLNYLKLGLQNVLFPLLKDLIDLFGEKVESYKTSFVQTNDKERNEENDLKLDMDLILLLNALEKIFTFCYSEVKWEELDSKKMTFEHQTSFKIWTDLVSGVFSADVPITGTLSLEMQAKEVLLYDMQMLIIKLYQLWDVPSEITNSNQDLLSSQERIKYRIRKLLECFLKFNYHESIESVVALWFNDKYKNIFLELLNGSQKNHQPIQMVQTLIEKIKQPAPTREKLLKLTIEEIWDFLEYYLPDQFGKSNLVQFFPQFLGFLKEYLNQHSAILDKHLYLHLMKTMSKVLVALPDSDDQRLKKETNEVLLKILDACIMMAGKPESGLWRRKDTSDSVDHNNSRVTSQSYQSIENLNNSTEDLPQKKSRPELDQLILQIMEYLSLEIVPNLRQLFHNDNEKFQSILLNIIYYLVVPYLKPKRHPFKMPALNLLCSISKQSLAYKTWRKEIWDLFMDHRFFQSLNHLQQWKAILKSIIQNEKERFEELLNRLNSSGGNILFTSKEQEIQNRAGLLKRISLLIYCSDRDQFLQYLPNLQEKLVETFKQPYHAAHREAYFCLLMLFMKISPRNLVSFWPVILTEMIRLFQSILKSQKELSSDTLAVLHACCKFLDFILLLNCQEFNLHQWIFISDALELLEEFPSAQISLVHFLSLKLESKREITDMSELKKEEEEVIARIKQETLRRPFFSPELFKKRVEQVEELIPFFKYLHLHWRLSVQQTVENFYDAFPVTQELTTTRESVSAESNLNERTTDLAYLFQLLDSEFSSSS